MSLAPLSGPVIILHKLSLPPCPLSLVQRDWLASQPERVRAAFSQLAVNTGWTLNSTCPVSEDTGRPLARRTQNDCRSRSSQIKGSRIWFDFFFFLFLFQNRMFYVNNSFDNKTSLGFFSAAVFVVRDIACQYSRQKCKCKREILVAPRNWQFVTFNANNCVAQYWRFEKHRINKNRRYNL